MHRDCDGKIRQIYGISDSKQLKNAQGLWHLTFCTQAVSNGRSSKTDCAEKAFLCEALAKPPPQAIRRSEGQFQKEHGSNKNHTKAYWPLLAWLEWICECDCQRRKIHPKKIHPKIKKFIWTSFFSEQFPLCSWLASQGGRQKFARTFRRSLCKRGVFCISGFWVGFWASRLEWLVNHSPVNLDSE